MVPNSTRSHSNNENWTRLFLKNPQLWKLVYNKETQFLPVSVLKGFTFLWICPFLPGCPFYWHRVARSSLLWSFVFLHFCCNFSFLTSNFIDFWVFSPLFFLMSLMVCQFYLFKEPTFNFMHLCYHFLHFFFTYFWSELYDFFPPTNFGVWGSSFSVTRRLK